MPDEGCVDTDNGATDKDGDGCTVYTNTPSYCGGYDDNDFFSNEMCCACGSGIQGIIPDILYDISYMLYFVLLVFCTVRNVNILLF